VIIRLDDDFPSYSINFSKAEVKAPAHPLAKSGSVPLIRFILHRGNATALEMPCFCCGFVLPWAANKRKLAYKHIINAVLRDPERYSDLTSGNVAASCFWCAIGRRRHFRTNPEFLAQVLAEHCKTYPADRPTWAIMEKQAGLDIF